MRLHVGGEIVVIDAESAGPQYDAAELVSGADLIVGPHSELPHVDLTKWQPRPPAAPIDGADRDLGIHRGAGGSLLVEAPDEPPLVLVRRAVKLGPRWAARAIVVTASATSAASVLGPASPRLIALAAPEAEVEIAMSVLSERLNGTVLMALEPGMALEV